MVADAAASLSAATFAEIDRAVTTPTRTEADRKFSVVAAQRRGYLAWLWLEWEFGAATVLGGSLVGWLAWRGKPRWQLWVVVWGVLFLGEAVWEYSGYHHRIPAQMLYFATASEPLRLLQANWWLAMFAFDTGEFRLALWMLYCGFLVPLVELAALLWLVWRNREDFTRLRRIFPRVGKAG